jgi:hypothetical protein
MRHALSAMTAIASAIGYMSDILNLQDRKRLAVGLLRWTQQNADDNLINPSPMNPGDKTSQLRNLV